MENTAQQAGTVNTCSFCGKSQHRVKRLTAGPGGVYICDECVDLYREHMEKGGAEPAAIAKLVQVCPTCAIRPPASHRYCYNCGTQLIAGKPPQ